MTSTEQDSRNNPPHPTPSLFDTLASANNFSRQDLEMNRAGQFSDMQKKRLLRKGLGYAAMFLGSIALVVMPVVTKLAAQSWRSIVFYAFVFLLFFLSFGWQAVAIFIDLWNGQVVSVQGPVVRLGERSRLGLSYFYLKENLRFSVSKPAYEALIPRLHYRIFYAPYSTQLVSIEPIQSHRQR